jgi:hypothetical protein
MVMHLEDGTKVVIVEGQVRRQTPSKTFAERLATLSNEKYGYGMAASDYERGVLVLRPRRVLAWMAFPKDATRFVFDER